MDMQRGFLKPLSFLGLGKSEEVATTPVGGSIKDREANRHDLTGAKMQILIDANLYVLHVKDLSSSGISGLTDAPLALDQVVVLYLSKNNPIAMQIRWIRRTLVGGAFLENLPEENLQALVKANSRKT